MEWLFLRLSADLITAGNVLLGKEMLTRYVPNQRLYLLCVALVSLPFAGWGLLLLAGEADPEAALLALAAGGCYIASGRFYYRAMAVADAVRFGLLLQAGPLFTLPLAVVLLGERFTAGRLLGLAVTFAASTLPLLRQGGGGGWLAPGAAAALASTALGASYGVLNKLLLEHYPVAETFALTRIGVVLGTAALLGLGPTWASGQALRQLPARFQAALLGEQIIRLVVQALLTQALAWSDSAAVVAVLGGFGPLYLWGFSLALGRTSLRDPALPRYLLALGGLLLGALLLTR